MYELLLLYCNGFYQSQPIVFHRGPTLFYGVIAAAGLKAESLFGVVAEIPKVGAFIVG